MEPTQSPATVSMDDVIVQGNVAARRIADDLSWGEGAIQPLPENMSPKAQEALVGVVLRHIAPVEDTELSYSSCTDGRLPVRLQSGEKVPVREQLVGADMVSAFYVAESLGDSFYKDPEALVADRVHDVAEFLHENGLLPSSHISCGAGGGFVAIAENIVRYGENPQYIARLKVLLPEGVYDGALHREMLRRSAVRIAAHQYEGLTADTFLEAVEKVSGKHAIAELRDDGRGIHGHVEEAIMRVHIPGSAIDEAAVAAETGGRQVFGVNDNRMERLARIFARGDDKDYRVAMIALEDFASGGHGTLAKGLPTYLVTLA